MTLPQLTAPPLISKFLPPHLLLLFSLDLLLRFKEALQAMYYIRNLDNIDRKYLPFDIFATYLISSCH
ncbi:hypothetical protein BJX76DRAFT_327454 [Aspergillus varians]